jgi:LmbE family N-acetylglucosaminyl deacetylase
MDRRRRWRSGRLLVRLFVYILASRGEAGIAGMPPEQAARLREAEQRRAAAIVGVRDLEFWDFPDGNLRNSPELRQKIADAFGGPEARRCADRLR